MNYTIDKIRCGSFFDSAAMQKISADERTLYPLLRRALNQRIRNGKAELRRQLSGTGFANVLKHPALTSLIGDMIRERAAQPSLFRVLLGVGDAD